MSDSEQRDGSLRDLLVRLRASRVTRRALLAGGVGAALWLRVGCYPSVPTQNLASWEVEVLRAAAEALLPPAPIEGLVDSIGPRVDAYLTTLPSGLRLEIHGLLIAVEQGTLLGLEAFRFTRLSPEDRATYLASLSDRGGYGLLIYRSLRDLVYLAYYQQDAAWDGIGYGGPLVGRDVRGDAYGVLRAAEGTVPDGFETL